jgi:hypothetical protein
VIAIGDTVIVTNEGQHVVTGEVPKKFHEISYTLDDDEEEGESEVSEVTNEDEEEKQDKKTNRADKLM